MSEDAALFRAAVGRDPDSDAELDEFRGRCSDLLEGLKRRDPDLLAAIDAFVGGYISPMAPLPPRPRRRLTVVT